MCTQTGHHLTVITANTLFKKMLMAHYKKEKKSKVLYKPKTCCVVFVCECAHFMTILEVNQQIWKFICNLICPGNAKKKEEKGEILVVRTVESTGTEGEQTL